MLMFTVEAVKPSDFNVKDHFWGSPFQKVEKEVVARNLVLLSKWNENKWLVFTWEEYRQKCRHNVTISEKNVLDGFVEQGLLKCENGVYSIRDQFIITLAQFIS
ncbi:MAG: hypothetical protein WC415_05805 [Patescibacteria group bacterium]|jgi:hypothetical protein